VDRPDTDPAGTAKRLAGLIAIYVAIVGLSLQATALTRTHDLIPVALQSDPGRRPGN